MARKKPVENLKPISTDTGTDDESFLFDMRERAQQAWSYWSSNYEMSREDRMFAGGQQWDSEVAAKRDEQGRPCLTVNKLKQFVNRVKGAMLQNPASIKVLTVRPGSRDSEKSMKSMVGDTAYTRKEVMESIIRNIQYQSNMDAHYSRAATHQLEGGFGWLRVLTKYCDDDTFDQDVFITSAQDPCSVIIDPAFTEPDASDMRYAFVRRPFSRAEFYKRWPYATPGDLNQHSDDSDFWYGGEETVYASEYWYRKPKTKILYRCDDGGVYSSEDGASDEALQALGLLVTTKRSVTTWCVYRALVTANSILEKPMEWWGSTIPIVPQFGEEVLIDNKRYYISLINNSKDAQRDYNVWRSAATEITSLQPKAPWVGPAQCFEGYEKYWQNANVEAYAFLPYKPGPNGERPERSAPPFQAMAEQLLALQATDDIKSTMGMYDASLGNVSNETSGKAIRARQEQSDMGNYVYTWSRNLCVQRIGKILVEIIPKIYSGERVVRLHNVDNSEDYIEINRKIGLDVMNDITFGKYDVVVTHGPSYSTAKQESVERFMELGSMLPAAVQPIIDLVVGNMDFPGVEEAAERLKRSVPPQLLDEEERPPPPPPDPNLQLQAQIEQSKAMQKQFDAQIADIKAKEAQVQAQAEIAKAAMTEDGVRDMVANAIAQFMAETGGQPMPQPAQQQAAPPGPKMVRAPKPGEMQE